MLRNTIILLLSLLLLGCSHKKPFSISGKVKGGRELTFKLFIYGPDGRSTETVASRSGNFDFSQNMPEDSKPRFIEIYTNDMRLVGLASVVQGARLSVTIDPDDFKGFRISVDNENKEDGDPDNFNSTLGTWLSSVKTIDNKTIADFVTRNPGNPAAYAILINLYDASKNPAEAFALLNKLKPSARPPYYDNGFETLLGQQTTVKDKVEAADLLCAADTIFHYNPADYKTTFIAFTVENPFRSDSIVPVLQEMAKDAKKSELLVMEHHLVGDTVSWRRMLRTDERNINQRIADKEREKELEKQKEKEKESKNTKAVSRLVTVNTDGKQTADNTKELPKEKVKWTSVWTGPGVSSPFVENFAIPTLPYFIVADSKGGIRYAGPSLQTARDSLKTK